MPIIFNSTSASFISACGPAEPTRFLDNKEINLIDFLPNYLKETETNDLVQFFQDFLNTLYDEKIYSSSALEEEVENRTKISVLEKINRITELHDPDLCDVEYLQYFADYLGYSVDLNRGELGILENQDSTDPCVQEDVKRYLRFIVSNLPNWYKIRGTNNAIKIMLYSFGLVGDLITRYTNDYKQDAGANWLNFRDGLDNFNNIPQDFYPTSHFVISIELDSSTTNFSLNETTRRNIFSAVESVRPANTVNDGYLGHIHRDFTIYTRLYCRKKMYVKFTLNGT